MFAMVFAVLVVLVIGAKHQLFEALRSKRIFGFLTICGVLLYFNQQGFVWGALNDRILETSLGYFINPFMTIALGVAFRGERLRPLQWTALGVASTAIIVLTVSYGRPPWLSLFLAITFAFYSFVKKQTAEEVDAPVGMAVEFISTLPIALIQLVIVFVVTGELAFATIGIGMDVLLILSGPLTVIPLMLFAAGTKRLPLVYVGFLQFLTPIFSFLFGYLVMHEAMPPARWVGFIIIWAAVILLLTDILVRMRPRRSSQPA